MRLLEVSSQPFLSYDSSGIEASLMPANELVGQWIAKNAKAKGKSIVHDS